MPKFAGLASGPLNSAHNLKSLGGVVRLHGLDMRGGFNSRQPNGCGASGEIPAMGQRSTTNSSRSREVSSGTKKPAGE